MIQKIPLASHCLVVVVELKCRRLLTRSGSSDDTCQQSAKNTILQQSRAAVTNILFLKQIE